MEKETIETHVEFNGDVIEVTFTVPSGLLWNTEGRLKHGNYDCPGDDAAALNLLRELSKRNDVCAAELFHEYTKKGRAVCTMKLLPVAGSNPIVVQKEVRIFTLQTLLGVEAITELDYEFKTTVVGEKHRNPASTRPAAMAVNSVDPPTSVSGAWSGA